MQDCRVDKDYVLLFRRGVKEVARHARIVSLQCQSSIQSAGLLAFYGLATYQQLTIAGEVAP
jgi:hypothetical protein